MFVFSRGSTRSKERMGISPQFSHFALKFSYPQFSHFAQKITTSFERTMFEHALKIRSVLQVVARYT